MNNNNNKWIRSCFFKWITKTYVYMCACVCLVSFLNELLLLLYDDDDDDSL